MSESTELIQPYKKRKLVHEKNAKILIEKNQEMQDEIYACERRINKLKDKIKKQEKVIWKVCKHEWKYDTGCCFDDMLTHFCTKCRLWRNSYMYQ
jgi:ABC-type Fe3+-citrate transport system substrate-binding protein